MGLNEEIKAAAESLQRCNPTSISLRAGCELFLRYTTRTRALESGNFAAARKRLIERGRHFAGGWVGGGVRGWGVLSVAARLARHTRTPPRPHGAETSKRARATIADMGQRFIRDGCTVLCHGHSRVVLAILRRAVASVRGTAPASCCCLLAAPLRCCCCCCCPARGGALPQDARGASDGLLTLRPPAPLLPLPRRHACLQGKQFSVIVTEGRPDETGLVMARVLEELKARARQAAGGAGGGCWRRRRRARPRPLRATRCTPPPHPTPTPRTHTHSLHTQLPVTVVLDSAVGYVMER